MHGIQTAARSHEEAIAAWTAETHIAAHFWQHDLTDAFAFGRKNLHAIVAFTHPAGAGPDVAVFVATNAIGEAGDFLAIEVHFHRGELSAVLQLRAVDVPDFDVLRCLGVMRGTGVGHIDLLVVRRETEAVGLKDFVGELVDPATGIDAIDRFFEQEVAFVALIVAQTAVARIGEPHAAIGMHGTVVGCVEGLAVELVGQHGDRVVGLVAHYAAIAVLEGNLPPLAVKGVAIAVASGLVDRRDFAVILEPTMLHVVRNIAPHEILPPTAPRRPFSPIHARVQPLDGRGANLVFLECLIERDDIRLGITHRRGTGAEITRQQRCGRE